MKRQYAVIGLGRFGGSICRALSEQGMEVLGIDMDEDRVNEYSSIATHTVIADSTDEGVLKNLGIRNFEHVIVAIGENLQSSILTTLILKDMGVSKITVKAQNDYHERVLLKIGADRIIHPERDMGIRIAHQVVSKNVLDYLELSDEYSIVEMAAGEKMSGKSLQEMNIRAKYGCNVVAVKRSHEVIVSPHADQKVEEGDVLIVIGGEKDISRLEKDLMA
ncbi:TrkA family potassium uptake protein [Fictibacillus sp. KIGAM418]|uniref:TrkA family potassium uptake protein n=1 Tax=Fictibacillus marinisediminis TaxID=2878389 RepID=A0A9X1XAY2_9BACL|nr:TrkA family potassium uptake protein [Fictibacillus marinisediminis]MCK6256846.1 TrkA family potassium uptake protein [Fictibacillus marinisediminis]